MLTSIPESLELPKPPVLGVQVLTQLRLLIITGKLPAGTHLVESQLSAKFDVSRGPIRDALNQLQAEGLVETRRRGSFVRGLTVADVRELYSVREAIEVMAMTVAIGLPEPKWSRLDASLEQMRDAAEVSDYESFATADMSFHNEIYKVSRNSRLKRIWQQYRPTFSVLLELTNAEDEDLFPALQSHVDIKHAGQERDIERATELLRTHLKGSEERLLASFSRMGHNPTKNN